MFFFRIHPFCTACSTCHSLFHRTTAQQGRYPPPNLPHNHCTNCTKYHTLIFIWLSKYHTIATQMRNYLEVHQENVSFFTFSSHSRQSFLFAILLCNIAMDTRNGKEEKRAAADDARSSVHFPGKHCGKTALKS